MVKRATTTIGVAVGTLLLAALDWPPEKKGAVVEPPGRPVKLEAVKTFYPQHPGPTNVWHARCTVRVFVDETGRPYHTDAKGCGDPFDRVAEKASAHWRFTPHIVDGLPHPAKTAVAVTFILGDPKTTKPPPPPTCNWWLIVGPTGEVTLGSAEPPEPCAGWIVDKVSADVPLTGAWGTCALSFTKGEDIDDSGCPPADRALGIDISHRSLFGGAARTTLIIDMPPGGAPPLGAEEPAPTDQ